ncbi:NAD(P)-dependent oxidoreductase [Novosphingobium sp. 9]|uniref:NAD(P)-dependent oxidoreductase n=1 Tax=Novosphingobium sp. 9 TaxID=2025349 RepID=UPI0021B51A20|nr:NAD(P)-dependent oxidoreductase [Novosphingobium sp. 9]
MKIGIIGLGSMGRGMAANLVQAGHEVVAWNRSGGEVAGVTMVATPAEAMQGEVLFTMLSQDETIEEVIVGPGLLEQATKGLIHVVSATISVAYAKKLVDLHKAAGLTYVSAPVLGRPDVAAAGKLNVLAAGPAEALAKVSPALEAMAGKVWDLGPEAPTANAVKIACNMMITMAIEGMAEAVVLSESEGCGREQFFEVMLGTLFGCRVYENYSGIIAKGEYQPGFKATLGLKDLRLASEVAKASGGDLPMLAAVHKRMGEAVEAGNGDKDWGVMAGYTIATAKGATAKDATGG